VNVYTDCEELKKKTKESEKNIKKNMSYINKWLRGHNVPEKPRSKSLDVEALERSGIRMIANVNLQFYYFIFS
jgi:transcriptional antiterminator